MGEHPFMDVRLTERGFSLPELKWRELLFIGALRPDGALYVRDLSRPLPPFALPHLFPEGVRFEAVPRGDRVELRRALEDVRGARAQGAEGAGSEFL